MSRQALSFWLMEGWRAGQEDNQVKVGRKNQLTLTLKKKSVVEGALV